jgi:sulfite reductase alpha subunit-like flavoprotein
MNPVSSPNSAPRRIAILYGSQTGNAQRIARQVSEAVKSLLEVDAPVYALNKAVPSAYQKVNLMEESLVLFVTSTTGDGDPPENATKLIGYLEREVDR